MEMKKNIFVLLFMLVLIVSCTEETYDIPRDANGNAMLTTVSSSTTTGISTLDDQFSVTAVLPNAKSGDVMNVELLKLQLPSGGTSVQLLPLTGTQKTVTVGSDLQATVSYTRANATLNNVGDYVEVSFNGETDYALQRVDMVAATSSTDPMVSGIVIDVARTAETAYFNVTVEPKQAPYSSDLVAKRKNGVNEAMVDVTGSPFSGAQPFLVPISGDDFAVGMDTMYYSFTATSGSYTDEITRTIIVRDPYFYLKKSATLTANSTADGMDLLINANVADDADPAETSVIVSVSAASGSLELQGGSAWLAASVNNMIEFVPSTLDLYKVNKSDDAIAAFEAGVLAGNETITAGPLDGEGVFIFKAVNGTDPGDTYYGMLKFVTSSGSTGSVTFEYRIGNMYAHLVVIH